MLLKLTCQVGIDNYCFRVYHILMNTDDILLSYRKTVESTREALRSSGLTEHQIINETINFPDLNKIIPDDVIKFFRDIRKIVILHLSHVGWTARKISQNLGLPYTRVWETVDEKRRK